MRDFLEVKGRFDAVQAIFSDTTITIEKLQSIRPLLSGIHPRMDRALEAYDRHLGMLQSALEGDAVTLSVETLPEETEHDKKKKAALLLFLKSQKELGSEMERVRAEFGKGQGSSDSSAWQKILSGAKGPLGLVTILAIAIVWLQSTSVKVSIQNDGCHTIVPKVSLPFPLPGFSLPKEPIEEGDSAIATVPALTFTVDGGEPGALSLSSLGVINLSFAFSPGDDVVFDGTSLIGKKTTLELGDKKTHTLTLSCR